MKKLTTPILIVGSARDCPDLEYASGFRAADPVVYLWRRQGHAIVVPDMEQGRAEAGARGLAVWTPRRLGLRTKQRGRISEWALALLRREGVRRICVAPRFPFAVGRRLQQAGIRVEVSRGPLFPRRAVKTTAEVAKIRESQQAAVIACRAAATLIANAEANRDGALERDGEVLTSERVRARIQQVLFEHHCIGEDIIVAGGKEAADPHSMGSGPLRTGEAIVIDIFPRHMEHGYWGDLTRTVAHGEPAPELRRMYQAVKAAQAAALEKIKPGVKCASVHRAVTACFDERGFETRVREGRPEGFIHSTGHGVGLAIHEGPSLGTNDERLRSGHVVTVEPGLYYPGIGGVRIEDTIVVRPGGWQYLVPCEKRFVQ